MKAQQVLVRERRHDEELVDSLEQAGRQFLRAYRTRQHASAIRYAWRMWCELYIARRDSGDDLPAPSWQKSAKGTATGWGKEIAWVGSVLDHLNARRRLN